MDHEDLVLRAHDLLGEAVVIGDGRRVLHVNDAACALYGRTREELLSGTSLFRFLCPGEQERIEALVRGLRERGERVPERFETALVRPDRTRVEIELCTTAVVEDAQVRTLTIVRDISERLKREHELLWLATHDGLTGLPNRTLLLDRIEQVLARGRRFKVSGALAFVDLDGFKRVNDEHGHATGDALLVEIAARLRAGLRECDTAARLGGDEFVVLCEEVADDAAAGTLAERIRSLIEQPFRVGPHKLLVRASIGLHRFEAGATEPEELLRRADAAMYEAKRSVSSP